MNINFATNCTARTLDKHDSDHTSGISITCWSTPVGLPVSEPAPGTIRKSRSEAEAVEGLDPRVEPWVQDVRRSARVLAYSDTDSRMGATAGADHLVPCSTSSSSHNSHRIHGLYIRRTLAQMQLQHLHSEHELQIEFQQRRFALAYDLAEADAFLNLECDNEFERSLPIEPANSDLVADSHSISGHFSQGGPTYVLRSGLPVVVGGPGTVTHTNRRLTGSVGGPTAISRSGPTAVSHGGPTAVSQRGPTAVSHCGPTAVSHSGPTAVSHGGATAVSNSGPTAISHDGPTAVSHGGPTVVSHGGPIAVSHGGRIAVSHGSPTAVSHGGPTAVSHRCPTAVPHVGPTAISHGGPTAIPHRRPAEGLYSRGPAVVMYGGPMDVPH